jgi:7-carboxy-7-deazaguanine synthase
MSNLIPVCEMFSSIQGEGVLAGRRQIFIRLVGCNLDCHYCDTEYAPGDRCRLESSPGSNRYKEVAQLFSPTDLLGIVKEWCSLKPGAHHSISLTGGEPLLSADLLSGWLPELRRILPLHLETNGTLPDELDKIKSSLDYISMDIKLPSTADCSQPLWELHRTFLQRCISKNTSVKVVVGNRAGSDEIRQVCEVIASVEMPVPLFLQPLTQADGTVGISASHLLNLQEIASSLLADVRVIPQMHKQLGVL